MNDRVKKIIKNVVFYIIILIIIKCTVSLDFNNVFSKFQFYLNIKNNIKFINKVINMSLPILIISAFVVAIKIFSQKWVFKIEKLSLSGMSIIFSNPDDLFHQQIKNFLNTKRTIFKVDENKDNFYETIESYYSIYEHIRTELKIFDAKSAGKSTKYNTANKMIQELNEFLAKHQNNYKRWYEYIINNNVENIYNEDISDIQKNYRKYPLLVEDFKNLNTFFCGVAKEFGIDTNKWDI